MSNNPVSKLPCPAEESWVRLAAGAVEGKEADALLLHAAECKECAASLKSATELFDEEEEAQVRPAPLSPKDRRKLSEKMAAPNWPRGRGWWPWASVAAAVLAIIVGGVYWRERAAAPLNLLATAYSANRPLELRIAGASYAPLHATRGDSGSVAHAPPELLESQTMINHHRESGKDDAQWLHAEGRADILWWRYDDAIRAFQNAADLGEATPDFWIDYASAFFERAESRSTPHDYTMAIELLSKALTADPKNPSALFNRAIVYSRLDQLDPAIADLERCLQVDGRSQWAAETRTHLNELRAARRRLLGAERIPERFLAEAGLNSALSGGLDQASRARASIGEESSLSVLATKLLKEHKDHWLSEALETRKNLEALRTIETLTKMAQIRGSVRIEEYSTLESAIRALQQMGLTDPLRVWRDFELLYRASHGSNFATCPPTKELAERCIRRGYLWFAIQVLLEQATCQTGTNQLSASLLSLEKASALCDESRFPAVRLRVQGFISSYYVDEGRYREAFQLDRAGLDQIIQDGYPVKRAHEFYNGMMRASEQMERWNSALASARMAREAAKSAQYPLLEATALSKEGDFAHAQGDETSASRFYTEAIRAFDRQAVTKAADAYRLYAEIGLLESRQDRDGLLALRERIPPKSDLFSEAALDLALARVAFARGMLPEAERRADQLIAWAAHPTANAALHSPALLRRELDAAGVLLTRARLLQGNRAGAYASWQQHLRAEAWLLGGSVQDDTSAGPLSKGTGIITLAALDNQTAIWLRTAGSLVFAWAQTDTQSILNDLHQLDRMCSTSQSSADAIQALVNRINQNLFLPVLKGRLELDRVYVQADGQLGQLPLGLFSGVSTLQPAFAPYPLRGAAGGGHGAVFISGGEVDPEANGALLPLPDAAKEIAAIAPRFPNSTVLTGPAATVAALDRAAAQASLFYFAGHAMPSRDGIALVASGTQNDGRSDLWRISPNSRMVADIADFSACSTAALQETLTVLPGRLAEAALLAGSRNVVATLWDVDSAASLLFHEKLYELIQAGLPIAAAMPVATKFLRAQPRFTHPNYWASFVLYQNFN